MEEKEILIFGSIWNRIRLLFYSKSIDKANELFFNMKCFIPRYRQWILCGDIPKKARFVKNVELIETKDFTALREAFLQSLAEEEAGTPPIQIVYFNAREDVFNNTLRHLDRGWIATASGEKSNLEWKSIKIYEETKFKEGIIYFLDPMLDETSIEEEIIKNTTNNSPGVRSYMVQMKENEVHFAFQAIQDELKTGEKTTQAYLTETLNIRQKTLKKIIEIGKKERRFDISSYIEWSPPHIINFLKGISHVREISLAAIFDKRKLIGYARYGDIVFPSQNFLRLSDRIMTSSEDKSNLSRKWNLEISAGSKNIFISNNDYLYGFILEKGINIKEFKSVMERLIKESIEGSKKSRQ